MLPIHRITQGTQATFKVPLLLDGVPTSTAGWSLQVLAKIFAEDPDTAALISCTADNGRVTDYDDVNWLVTIPAAATATLPTGHYALEYRGIAPDGQPQRLELCSLYLDPSPFPAT